MSSWAKINRMANLGVVGNRISGNMTAALTIYSAVFMRYSLAVQPKNYLLFLCHFINEGSQLTQGYRYLNYHRWGGKEKMEAEKLAEAAKEGAAQVKDQVKTVVEKGKEALTK
jgi:mitochondrial pyruvate carrier 1